jgi:hypothetical protein
MQNRLYVNVMMLGSLGISILVLVDGIALPLFRDPLSLAYGVFTPDETCRCSLILPGKDVTPAVDGWPARSSYAN